MNYYIQITIQNGYITTYIYVCVCLFVVVFFLQKNATPINESKQFVILNLYGEGNRSVQTIWLFKHFLFILYIEERYISRCVYEWELASIE